MKSRIEPEQSSALQKPTYYPGYKIEENARKLLQNQPFCPRCVPLMRAAMRSPKDRQNDCLDQPTDAPRSKQLGTYCRKSDGVRIQRYFCFGCKRSFSSVTSSPLRYSKIRHRYADVYSWFVTRGTGARSAFWMKIAQSTFERALPKLGKCAIREHQLWLNMRYKSDEAKIKDVQFDEMETHQHSKLKPISIPLAVENHTRKILGFSVAKMPYRASNREKGLKKYGHRPDRRARGVKQMIAKFKHQLAPCPQFHSDMAPRYKVALAKNLMKPEYSHFITRSRKACVVGQGELKSGGRDPLFSINHTCAMLRADIARLFRRTWNTTKKASRLYYHIAIYVVAFNSILTKE